MSKSKLQLEGEVYYPSNEVVDQARLKDWDEMAEKARKDPQAFWAAEAEELEWFKKWDQGSRQFKEAILQMVRGGQDQYRSQCNRPTSQNIPQK